MLDDSQLSFSSTSTTSILRYEISSTGSSLPLPPRTLLITSCSSISAGFISEKNRGFMIFLDSTEAADFDWGVAALAAIDSWEAAGAGGAVQLDLKWS